VINKVVTQTEVWDKEAKSHLLITDTQVVDLLEAMEVEDPLVEADLQECQDKPVEDGETVEATMIIMVVNSLVMLVDVVLICLQDLMDLVLEVQQKTEDMNAVW
jgi:hypothetical protein